MGPDPIERLIDANLNRLREGLRVLEDLCRYLHDDAQMSALFKQLRHELKSIRSIRRILLRNIEGDVSKSSTTSEMQRSDHCDLAQANFARCMESARVLEESFKLIDPQASALFKELRYRLYALEKRYVQGYCIDGTEAQKA